MVFQCASTKVVSSNRAFGTDGVESPSYFKARLRARRGEMSWWRVLLERLPGIRNSKADKSMQRLVKVVRARSLDVDCVQGARAFRK